MGDNDGSSNAAQSARQTGQKPGAGGNPAREAGSSTARAGTAARRQAQGGFLGKLLGLVNGSATGQAPAPSPQSAGSRPLHGLINLRRMRVDDVSIPKADIVAVPVTISKDDLAQVFRETGLTRLPVFDGTLDTPVGMAHLKDFALSYGFGGNGGRFNLKKMLRPLMFVPPSMPLGVLLTKMQTERRHMALVIDEYGGVDGLVTIEDLIEQVVGEIEDEHDTDEGTYWTREKSGTYLVQAKTPLEEFEAELGVQLTEHEDIDAEEIDTLGGLVFMLAGHVPARGEVVPHPAGYDFEVVDADPRRIKRLRVRPAGLRPAAPASPAATPAQTAPAQTAAAKPTVAGAGHG